MEVNPVTYKLPQLPDTVYQESLSDKDDLEMLKWAFMSNNVMQIIGKDKTPKEIGHLFKEWSASFTVQ